MSTVWYALLDMFKSDSKLLELEIIFGLDR